MIIWKRCRRRFSRSRSRGDKGDCCKLRRNSSFTRFPRRRPAFNGRGRQRLLTGLEKFGTQFASILATPGDVEKQGFDIHDPVDMERAQSLGLLIGLGKQSPKVEAFPRIGRSTPGEVDAFLHQAEGFKTRQEIDEFLAGKAAPGKDPKQVLQIEMAKADSAKLDDAIAAAEGSNTKARSPQMLEDFIAGHDTDNIHLPAEAVADLYRAEGKTPAEGDGLFGFVPGLKP
jgi:hypothetical protein